MESMDDLSLFKLPRHHRNFSSRAENVSIHLFCDASEKGFGSVAYLQYTIEGEVIVSFLASKTHVAPLKK
jgi:hypothetical protein